MNWLTDNKIPIDDAAEAVFDWLLINAGWLFDGLAVAMEWLIDAILWVLQTPHPLIVIAVFGALTWAIQRNWKTPLLIVLGFLFILNQDYWEETTESLTLVLSACVVCMGVGVPIGIAMRHPKTDHPVNCSGEDHSDPRLPWDIRNPAHAGRSVFPKTPTTSSRPGVRTLLPEPSRPDQLREGVGLPARRPVRPCAVPGVRAAALRRRPRPPTCS